MNNHPEFLTNYHMTDNVDDTYLKVLSNLVYSIYIHRLSGSHIHPLFKSLLERCRQDAIIYADKTQNLSERDVILILLEYCMRPNSIPNKRGYIPLDIIDRTLSKYEGNDMTHIFPKTFYYPFLKTLSNRIYIGEATFVSFSFNIDGIRVYHDTTKRQFDNTDKVDPTGRCGMSLNIVFYLYLSSFDLSGFTFDHLINIMANWSTPNPNTKYRTFIQIINLYIGKGIIIDDEKICVDSTLIKILLQDLSRNNRSLDLKNSKWFGLLYKYTDLSPYAYDYLMKLPHMRTVHERNAYNASYLSDYPVDDFEDGIMSGRTTALVNEWAKPFSHGIEAVEDELDEEEEVDEETPETDDPEEEPEEEESESDDESKEISDDDNMSYVVGIDITLPEEETHEDILYKESVCRTVSQYKKDPPEGLSQEELLLLSRWCNQWIFLVSADTTKQFLKLMTLTITID